MFLYVLETVDNRKQIYYGTLIECDIRSTCINMSWQAYAILLTLSDPLPGITHSSKLLVFVLIFRANEPLGPKPQCIT